MNKIHPNEPPRVSLANLPTPLVPAPRLARELNCDEILIKRDDLTGMELSGNKVRKLEYLLAAAVNEGCDTVVTMGAAQSNHCRATAAAAAKLGLHTRLILRSPDPSPANVGNLLLSRLFGAEISLHAPDEYNGRRAELIDRAMNDLRAARRRPYFFGVGGSNAIGAWGYIRAMHELSQQIDRNQKYQFYVPLSSTGTMCGVLLGRAMFEMTNVDVTGVLVSDDLEYFRREIPAHVNAVVEQFNLPRIDTGNVKLLDQYIGAGYAAPTAGGLEAMQLLARLEGLILDPVYTAKNCAGMIDQLRQHGDGGRIPIFLHSGGVFGMLARPDLLG